MNAPTGTPAYRYIADNLRRQIEGGELPAGSQLPTVARLMAEYDVSSTVIKSAIALLKAENIVVGQQGKGVYVRNRAWTPRRRRNHLMSDSQIFVSGTWRTDKAAKHADAARRVGQLIAEAGYSLGCGPGTGVARHAIDGFRSVTDRTGKVRYFLPAEHHMKAAGEEVEPGADEIIQTDLDYPMRNVHQISESVGLIVITGGDGASKKLFPPWPTTTCQ